MLVESTHDATRLRLHVRVLDSFRRLVAGELDGIDDDVRQLVADTQPDGTPSMYRGIAGIAFQLRLLRARPLTTPNGYKLGDHAKRRGA